jgi:hypothetical protein
MTLFMAKLLRIIFLLITLSCCSNIFASDFTIHSNHSFEKEKKEKKSFDEEVGAAQKGNFMIQVSLNVAHHLGFAKNYSSFGYGYVYDGIIPGLTLNLDYNVHRYVGVGLFYSVGFQNYKKSNVFYLGNAFGARGTFHWWQLLDDKSDVDLFSDKIDFDIHAHLGGFALSEKNKNDNSKVKKFGFNAGAGVGFKFYFVKSFGVAIDAGFEEASYAKLGLVIKI